MRKSATMFISSITGNTRLIANNLIEELHQSGWRVHLYRKGNIVPKENLVILCFWCRRSSIESTTLNFLRSIKGRKVIAFCTMGGNPNSPYGLRVRENIRVEIEENNTCLGVYLCQGRIDPERTWRRRRLPRDHRHYLDDEGLKRHLKSQSHPDERDVDRAKQFLAKQIRMLKIDEDKR